MGERARQRAQATFLEQFAETANVLRSCQAAGIHRSLVYTWRRSDPAFAERFDVAAEDANDVVEDEIRRRAVDGWDEPVWHQGEQCGVVRKYSDTLLIVLAKARMPDRYRDRTLTEQQHSGRIEVEFVNDWRVATRGERGEETE